MTETQTKKQLLEKLARYEANTPTVSLVKNENNQPRVFYHGTLTQFENFYPLSHFGTKTAAKEAMIFQAERFDDQFSEEDLIDKNEEYQAHCKEKLQKNGRLIPVALNVSHPAEIIDIYEHNILNYRQVVLNVLERESYSTLLLQAQPFLRTFAIAGLFLNYKMPVVPPVYDMIFKDPFRIPDEQVIAELQSETLYQPLKGSSNMVENCKHLAFQRMIRFFERRGIDGFKYVNQWEDKGHYSYIIFRPEQVIQLNKELPQHLKKRQCTALSDYEKQALDRYVNRSLSEVENRMRLNFQKNVLQYIPKSKVLKNKELLELTLQYFPHRCL